MYLTRDEIFCLPADAFARGVLHLCNAIFNRFACGVSPETAARILRDYRQRS